ncbi:MAG: DUF1844 domain-containing protein [Myxococcota bacterium]
MARKEAADTPRGLPVVDFSTFVLSLAAAALHQLGIVPGAEQTARQDADPLVVRETIETLEMLREKTQGNLTEEERRLIDSLLFDLRMRFVELGR